MFMKIKLPLSKLTDIIKEHLLTEENRQRVGGIPMMMLIMMSVFQIIVWKLSPMSSLHDSVRYAWQYMAHEYWISCHYIESCGFLCGTSGYDCCVLWTFSL